MTKQFAPDYSRTPEGWVRFPPDSSYRQQMFPEEVNQHPAKANVYLIQAIIEYVSEPGQLLLDPMSGTGTLMVGALIGRDIVCIEISESYYQLQQQALDRLEMIAPGILDHVSLVNLPCQRYLPIPNLADHIIFSPPYASIMKTKGTDKLTADLYKGQAGEYSSNPLNLGLMNDFVWTQTMEQIYKKCYQTLRPGGTLTLIVKDHYKDRKRVALSQAAEDACIRVGFQKKNWLKWLAPGSAYTNIYRARGWEVVAEEDVIIVQKDM